MRIRVNYTSQLQAALGLADESLQLTEGARLADALTALAARHSSTFHDWVLDDHQRMRPSVLICLDDRQVDLASNPPLQDGATLTFLSAISGG